jgi:hypothetical protein
LAAHCSPSQLTAVLLLITHSSPLVLQCCKRDPTKAKLSCCQRFVARPFGLGKHSRQVRPRLNVADAVSMFAVCVAFLCCYLFRPPRDS